MARTSICERATGFCLGQEHGDVSEEGNLQKTVGVPLFLLSPLNQTQRRPYNSGQVTTLGL